MVGDTMVTAVYDGYIDLNPKHLAGMPRAVPLLKAAVNAFLVGAGK